MTWYYYNTPTEITSDQTDGYFGFVYLITHIKTGQKYVGKKFFTKSKTKQVKGKKKKIRVASDWETYWGSNTKLQEDARRRAGYEDLGVAFRKRTVHQPNHPRQAQA